MLGDFVAMLQMRKKSCGERCGLEDSLASSFAANIPSEVTISTSIAPTHVCRSNLTASNTGYQSSVNATPNEKNPSPQKVLKRFASGIINGGTIARESCWKYGTHCIERPVVSRFYARCKITVSFLRKWIN